MSHTAYYNKMQYYKKELEGHIDASGELDEYAMELLMPQKVNAKNYKTLFLENQHLKEENEKLKDEIKTVQRNYIKQKDKSEEIERKNAEVSDRNYNLNNEIRELNRLLDINSKSFMGLQGICEQQQEVLNNIAEAISGVEGKLTDIDTGIAEKIADLDIKAAEIMQEITKPVEKKGLWRR